MHIVFEHPRPLPVRRYGGTERFLYWLMRELVRQGHRVSLIGPSGSTAVREVGIELIPLEEGRPWWDRLPRDADMLHLFSPAPDRELPIPFVVTIEGNGKPGETFHLNTVFVSRKHAANHGSESFVYNGIDLEEYPFTPPARLKGWGDFLFLAKAKWKVKNLDDCIRACRRTRRRLHVAGGRRLLLSRFVRFYGMADQAKKLELLGRTDALLFPVRWHEPFGIAVIEAMSAGLPVIASPYGSLPELVSAPEVGVICRSYSEFEEAIRNPPREYHPAKIREFVHENFRIEKIARQYVALYEKVLGGHSLNPTAPRTLDGFEAERLLPF